MDLPPGPHRNVECVCETIVCGAVIFFSKQDEEYNLILVNPQSDQVQMIVETAPARLSDLQEVFEIRVGRDWNSKHGNI